MDGCDERVENKNMGWRCEINITWSLFEKSEQGLQQMGSEFGIYTVCDRRKLKVNAGKSKVIVWERQECYEIQMLEVCAMSGNNFENKCGPQITMLDNL